jgi:hypothetical protein
MKRDLILAAFLLAAGSWLAVADGVAAMQAQAQSSGSGGRIKTYVDVGDDSLLTPEQMTPETDSRRVVDSFLVGAFTGDLDTVYDAYLHPEVQADVTREDFTAQIMQMRQAAGSLSRVILTYLRETPRTYEGMDGGWTENLLVFERDPRVGARVDFRRVEDGHWKIFNYAFSSQQLERALAAKAAAMEAAKGVPAGSDENAAAETPASEPPPQP